MASAILSSQSLAVGSQPCSVYVRRCTTLKKRRFKIGFLFVVFYAFTRKSWLNILQAQLQTFLQTEAIYQIPSDFFYAPFNFQHESAGQVFENSHLFCF